ncbi:hypothetical protein B0H14DRAFT_3495536 [Mycena olivaceomarginata]|nr:hypothetical protein B0H14DRAFT_3495536 [Mycena olivaceomarginata]
MQCLLLLSWLAPGGGRGIVGLDLVNCEGVQSTPSLGHSAAREDAGGVAARKDDDDSLVDLLVPFQMVYEDGVERLAAESLLERQKWGSSPPPRWAPRLAARVLGLWLRCRRGRASRPVMGTWQPDPKHRPMPPWVEHCTSPGALRPSVPPRQSLLCHTPQIFFFTQDPAGSQPQPRVFRPVMGYMAAGCYLEPPSPMPPLVEPILLFPDSASPGLFGPRSPRGDAYFV